MAMYYSLTDHPERADTLIKNVKAFAARQDDGFYAVNGTCASPRLNSLMAGAKACEAARDMSIHRDPRHIVELYNKTYKLLLNSDSKHNLPKTCANMADAYMLCNDLPNAAKWYRRALFLVDSLELPQKENITLYMGLAQISTTTRPNLTSRKCRPRCRLIMSIIWATTTTSKATTRMRCLPSCA